MTKAEKNYKRDYGHKDSEVLALNYTRDGMKEALDGVFAEVSPNDLTADEQEYLDGRNQCRNHTLNIRYNDTECKTRTAIYATAIRIFNLSSNT